MKSGPAGYAFCVTSASCAVPDGLPACTLLYTKFRACRRSDFGGSYADGSKRASPQIKTERSEKTISDHWWLIDTTNATKAIVAAEDTAKPANGMRICGSWVSNANYPGRLYCSAALSPAG
ncbi:hypothetical protein ABIA94_002245 [Bradyrhizobium sp. LA7.1]